MSCKKLITQFQTIQEGQVKLNQQIEDFDDLKNSQPTIEFNIKFLRNLYQSRKELGKLIGELKFECFHAIETKNYITVEGEPTQETDIQIDFEAILTEAIKFYKKHEINLPPDFEARAKEIWTKNYEAIQKEIATYGYDNTLIIPDNLPNLVELNAKMTAEYAETYQYHNFREGGSFEKAKNSKSKDNTFRLVLIHNFQNLVDQPLLNATRGKSPEKLTVKNKADIEVLIANQRDLPIAIELKGIKFGSDKTTKNNTLQAEGLTLAEYLIFQRQYFEVTGKHLDENGWTWLLSTFSAHSLADSGWYQGLGRLDVDVDDAGHSSDGLGCRPSRSFK